MVAGGQVQVLSYLLLCVLEDLIHVLGVRTDDLLNQASQPESRYISVLGVPPGTLLVHHGVPLQEPVRIHLPLHVHLK